MLPRWYHPSDLIRMVPSSVPCCWCHHVGAILVLSNGVTVRRRHFIVLFFVFSECMLSCKNCGTLNRNTCTCTCPEGYYGVSCEGWYNPCHILMDTILRFRGVVNASPWCIIEPQICSYSVDTLVSVIDITINIYIYVLVIQ